MKKSKILTDNGKEFPNHFCATGERQPTVKYPFNQEGNKHRIEHCVIKPCTPQTNGIVEGFNGRIVEVVKQTEFVLAKQFKETMTQSSSQVQVLYSPEKLRE